MPVRITYNALAARPGGTGVQTYIREVLDAIARRCDGSDVHFTAAVQQDAAGELPRGFEARLAPVAAGLRRAVAGLRSLGDADLVHGLDVDVPLRHRAPTVATVHDLTPFDVPWTMSKRKAIGERVLYRQVLRRVDEIIVDSAFTAERLEAVLGRPATVVHLGTPSDLHAAGPDAIEAIKARYELPASFVLHVGTLEPRKDVATVAAACRDTGIPLVLAGRVPPGQAQPLGARALGYVARDDLAALYGAATITVAPSRYEGFGLPPLEAMACGSAVIASRVASLPEVLGDAALLVAPGDVDGWTKAIELLSHDHDHRIALVAAGRTRAASFTWDATARNTIAVYESLGVSISGRR